MHKALIGAGRERVGTLGGNGRLGRHPRVTDRVRTGHAIKIEAGGNLIGPSNFLENFHPAAAAYDSGLPVFFSISATTRLAAGLRHGDDQVRTAPFMSKHRRTQAAQQRLKIKICRGAQRKLGMIWSDVSINRKPGRVRPTIA